jgi:hypothetical protein
MFIMATVASLCAVLLIANLLALACRHREDLWIASEDAILCVASPGVILLFTFGAVSLGWRMTHGGFGAIPVWGWIGSGIIVAITFAIWRVLAPRLRAGARTPASPAAASLSPVPAAH